MNRNKVLLLLVATMLVVMVGCSTAPKTEEVSIDDVKAYISSTTYNNISFEKVFTDLGLSNDDTRIAGFNFVINKDEKLDTINIKYYNKKDDVTKMVVYRRNLDRLSILKSANTKVSDTDYVDPLKLADNSLDLDIKELMTSDKHENVYVEVLSTNKISVTYNDVQSFFVNNNKVKEAPENLPAITFVAHPQPIQPGDVPTNYIY